jgi:two-component system, OmpR family, response regulator
VSTQVIGAGNLLLIDGDDEVLTSMASTLRREGFRVDIVHGQRFDAGVVAAVGEGRFDLLIANAYFKGLDRREATTDRCARNVDTPLLCIGTKEDLRADSRRLKESGAHCLAMPFSITELVTRIRTTIHRKELGDNALILRFSDVVMDEVSGQVWRGGTPVPLTRTEFNLLHVLLLNPRHVMTKHQIVGRAWHYEFQGSPKIVETYMCHLRKKLEALGPPLILTIRHVGYVLR